MPQSTFPTANPSVVLREELDDSSLLFNPDTGSIFGLNAAGLFIWKRLDGRHSEADIIEELHLKFDNIPEGADDLLKAFIQSLLEQGLAEYR